MEGETGIVGDGKAGKQTFYKLEWERGRQASGSEMQRLDKRWRDEIRIENQCLSTSMRQGTA